ncbi:sortase [Okibacterium fritillariae]|uniref:sortase n=1 Tax=Okibacterium fritillariae TaxID=123320 RepID=UPI0040554610
MSATTLGTRKPRSSKPPRTKTPRVDAPAQQRVLALILTMISATILALLANLVLISPIQNYASQKSLFSELRLSLAEGSAPTGPVDENGQLIPPGTPLAVFAAPSVGLPQEVVVEGTASAQTMLGIGHRRDTVLPCQVGTSVLMARASSYGAAGSGFQALKQGDRFGVTTSQGACSYEVIGIRMAGDTAPPPVTGREGRLTLTTAAGAPFMPTEVYRVDARLVSDGFDRPAVAIPTAALPPAEAAMGTDSSNLFGLVLLVQLLVALGFALAWLWRRWGRGRTWLVGFPPVLAVGLLAASAITQWLIPNLL